VAIDDDLLYKLVDIILKDKLPMQASRLIEMQTPLYLEGVRSLHPYFQKQHQGSGNILSSNLQARASS